MLRGIAHIRGHETDRLAALARELGGLGADVAETEDGLAFRPAPLHGGLFHTYADHRMAHAGVVVGSAVDDVLVEDVGTTAQDLPRLPRRTGRGCWGPRAHVSPGQRRYGEQDQEHYDRPRRRTRPRTKERPTYDDAHDGLVLAVDRGRFGLLVDEHAVTAMKARPLGRKAVVVGDRVRVVGDVVRRRRAAWPGSSRSADRTHRAAPQRGRRRRRRAGDRRQRRPARHRQRARRPRAAPAA